MVRPETVVGWHRQGFRHYWAWKSQRRLGRPAIRTELRDLIRRISRANPLWGAVLRQNLIPLSGRRRPTLSRQAKERLGDCRQEGRQAVRARRAATEGRRTFRGWGGE